VTEEREAAGFLQEIFCVWFWLIVFAYREGVGITPAQSVDGAGDEGVPAEQAAIGGALDGILLDELWQECGAANYGLGRGEFSKILLEVGAAENLGVDAVRALKGSNRQHTFAGSSSRLVLARACATGNEDARGNILLRFTDSHWRAPQLRSRGSGTLGRELADQLYAELFGMATRDGVRRCR